MKIGGARRDRTADLLHAMQALSQLSYGPIMSQSVLCDCSVTAGRILGIRPCHVNGFFMNFLCLL